MINAGVFIKALIGNDVRFVTGVPDSLLKNFCATLDSFCKELEHIPATNEGAAVGLAIGHYLASGRPALVYLQNSGIGNATNPVVSLADPQVYGIPMILMIGWRGEVSPAGKQLVDEPQHLKQGKITLHQLESMDIPYNVVGVDVENGAELLRSSVEQTIARHGPVALVFRRNTFEPIQHNVKDKSTAGLMKREKAIDAVIKALPTRTPVVSTTGMTSRELFELRRKTGSPSDSVFLTIGGMGHAAQIAAGIASVVKARKIVCIDGDGALLMHAGSLAVSAKYSNLMHIMINNGVHDSVGGQPTQGVGLNYAEIARSFGYKLVAQALTIEEITKEVRRMCTSPVSCFLEIKCAAGYRSNLGRPDCIPSKMKNKFMSFVQSL